MLGTPSTFGTHYPKTPKELSLIGEERQITQQGVTGGRDDRGEKRSGGGMKRFQKKGTGCTGNLDKGKARC